jgi:nitric oxide reductase NorE protein
MSQRPLQIPGEPGVWVFLICEMVVFTALFGVIAFNGSVNRQIFADAQHALITPLGMINTCVLIGGSVVVMLAIADVQAGRHSKAARLMAAAMACGVVFAVIKGIEYATVIHHGMWIHTNVFWLLFFVVTGAHLLHVLVGVTVLGLARRAMNPRTRCADSPRCPFRRTPPSSDPSGPSGCWEIRASPDSR